MQTSQQRYMLMQSNYFSPLDSYVLLNTFLQVTFGQVYIPLFVVTHVQCLVKCEL